MLMIEYVITGTGFVITGILGFFIGKKIGRIKERKAMNHEDFITKYYSWYVEQANKKIGPDRLDATLMKYGTQRQIKSLRKYYFKKRKEDLKQQLKDMKFEALRKKYQDIINEKPLK